MTAMSRERNSLVNLSYDPKSSKLLAIKLAIVFVDRHTTTVIIETFFFESERRALFLQNFVEPDGHSSLSEGLMFQ